MTDEALKATARENCSKIGDSDCFLVIWNDSIVEEVVPLIQMGLAVYLNKPVVVLIPTGAQVPENLLRMARAIEEFDPQIGPRMDQVKRLMDAALAVVSPA